MRANIDGDILLYQFGSLTDDEGNPLRHDLIINHLNSKIREIKEAVNATDYMIYISGKDNFRVKEATIKPYKGNREGKEKPHAYDMVKSYLTSGKPHPYTLVDGMEADDALGIAQHKHNLLGDQKQSIVCSNDKDLDMVPGKHYGWAVGERIKEKPVYSVGLLEAIKSFYLQLLTGDSTDNIPGLYRVGPVNAKKLLDGITEPYEMYCKVRQEYEARFGSYWELFMHENARLLWILRSERDDIRFELKRLEDKRQHLLKEEEEY